MVIVHRTFFPHINISVYNIIGKMTFWKKYVLEAYQWDFMTDR